MQTLVGLAPFGWTRSRLNELIKGKRGITAAAALDLADALGTSAKLWMNLQATYDLDKAAKSREVSLSRCRNGATFHNSGKPSRPRLKCENAERGTALKCENAERGTALNIALRAHNPLPLRLIHLERSQCRRAHLTRGF
jgi:plasmid maintenance system antidote protein VapI